MLISKLLAILSVLLFNIGLILIIFDYEKIGMSVVLMSIFTMFVFIVKDE